MNRISELWDKLMAIPMAGWIVSFAGLAILLLVAFYVVGKLRTMALGEAEESVNHLSDFEQLKNQGMLSDEEFKRVKAIAPQPLLEGVSVDRLSAESAPTDNASVDFEEVSGTESAAATNAKTPDDQES